MENQSNTSSPSDGASCSESSYQAWGNDKPFCDVFNSLSTDTNDKVSVDIIKETLTSIWNEKGRRAYEDPLEAVGIEKLS
jgi:hypothetical protein